MNRPHGAVAIIATLVVALILTLIPIPDWARPFRPPWYTLVLIYWVMALPARLGVFFAAALGLVVDTVSGTLLGQHAIGLAFVAYVVQQTSQRLRLFPLWQQAVVVLSLLLLERAILFWGMGVSHQPLPPLDFWVAPFVGMLLWPWVYIVLRDIRRRFVT